MAHHFKINYEDRYRLFDKNDKSIKENEEFTLKQLSSSLTHFESQGKNRSDASNLSLIRNLENIVYCSDEDINKCKNTLELQILIDSAIPKVTSESAEEKIQNWQKNITLYKKEIENQNIFASEKEKMLGLPFMMKRHQQFPEPVRGTWQYDIFEEIYDTPYEDGKGEYETEEKIHKFNYKKFLHPSIIEKFNDNIDSEEFDMYIKKKNIESRTRMEDLKEKRTFFCKNILPKLNLLNDPQKGKDFAHFMINKGRCDLKNHFDQNYSGQKEEKLFREAEELRLLDKNPQVVSDVELSTVKQEYKGFRAKELKEILSNTGKRSEVETALRKKFITHSPNTKYELYKRDRNRLGLIDTAIEEGIDLNNPEDVNYEKLFAMTYDNPDRTEDEEAALSYKVDPNDKYNTLPLGKHFNREMIYNRAVSFNDYIQDNSENSLLSAKTMRYENRQKDEEEKYLREFSRKYANPEFKAFECTIVPHKERENEELQEKIFKRKPLDIFNDRLSLYKSEQADMLNFINHRVNQDSSRISPDLTEDDLNQALFEAQYQKPIEESEEYKKLSKRNFSEIDGMFKALKIVPDELWDDQFTDVKTAKTRPYYEYAQITDPLYHLISEVEQPEAMRKLLKEWRKGAEIRSKLPYYPETKRVEDGYFRMI